MGFYFIYVFFKGKKLWLKRKFRDFVGICFLEVYYEENVFLVI